MRTALFTASGAMPNIVRLVGIALLVVVVFLFIFGTVTPFVNLLIAALVAMFKAVGVAAVTASPLALIKLGVL